MLKIHLSAEESNVRIVRHRISVWVRRVRVNRRVGLWVNDELAGSDNNQCQSSHNEQLNRRKKNFTQVNFFFLNNKLI